jgi:hypothetical protein
MPANNYCNYDDLNKARPVMEIMSKFRKVYNPSHVLAVDKARTGFNMHFDLKQYVPVEATKRGIYLPLGVVNS